MRSEKTGRIIYINWSLFLARNKDVPIGQVCSIARDALTRSISQGRSDGNALLYLDPLFVKDIRNDMKRIDAPRDMPTMVQTHIDRQMVDTVVVATRDAQGEWKYEVYNRVKDIKRQVRGEEFACSYRA